MERWQMTPAQVNFAVVLQQGGERQYDIAGLSGCTQNVITYFYNATIFYQQQELQNATGPGVSDQTVQNRLHEVGVASCKPLKCPVRTPSHRSQKMYCTCTRLKLPRNTLWNDILCTDESRFCLKNYSRYQRTSDVTIIERCSNLHIVHIIADSSTICSRHHFEQLVKLVKSNQYFWSRNSVFSRR